MLRSTFDPLPRSLSTPGLVSLVLVVVLGTAVTVHRYLESSGHPPAEVWGQQPSKEAAIGSRLEGRGMSVEPRASSLGSSRVGSCSSDSSAGSTASAGCTSTSAPATAAQPTTPSAFEPQ
jgi:hypothetical protein